MKTTKLAALIAVIALVLFIAMPNLSWAAEDGKALYGAKCAACHKADGSGNTAMKAPAINSAGSADKVADTIAKNPKHAALSKSLKPDQVKAIADYVKTLAK
jgi:mono/diheme cytochrome c family protein